MDPNAMQPHGAALLDFFKGDTDAKVLAYRDDGLQEEIPFGAFFGEPRDFPPLEQTALSLCRGRVLDVGAGAGRHTFALQDKGLLVWAIDICPEAVEIMRERGVKKVRLADVFDLQGERFDTLLMLMHGIGIVETLGGLDRFLNHAHKLVTVNGQILLDSRDIRRTDKRIHLAYQESNRRAGRYFGEIRMQFEYRGKKGAPFGWLHVDPETLAGHAAKAHWICRVIHQEENGDYLAQLAPEAGE